MIVYMNMIYLLESRNTYLEDLEQKSLIILIIIYIVRTPEIAKLKLPGQ